MDLNNLITISWGLVYAVSDRIDYTEIKIYYMAISLVSCYIWGFLLNIKSRSCRMPDCCTLQFSKSGNLIHSYTSFSIIHKFTI